MTSRPIPTTNAGLITSFITDSVDRSAHLEIVAPLLEGRTQFSSETERGTQPQVGVMGLQVSSRLLALTD